MSQKTRFVEAAFTCVFSIACVSVLFASALAGAKAQLEKGSKPLVFMALKAILEPGDSALIHEPGWLSYAEQINLCNAEAKYIPFDVEIEDFGKYFQKNSIIPIPR